MASRSIWTRRRDLVYLFFFVIHIPIMLVVDLTPLYPNPIKPQWVLDVRMWYITTYKDRFFVEPPAYFRAFTILEAVYHLPLSTWAVGAILRDDPLVPLHLLIWSVETAMSTLTCTVEAMSWEGFTKEEKIALAQLYVPYLVLAIGMGLDMFMRLKTGIRAIGKEKVG